MKLLKVISAVMLVTLLIATPLFASGQKAAEGDDGPLRIALVVKSLGNAFFEAARDGAEEAANELGNVELIYQGPSEPTAEGQIQIIDSLIAQQVDGIAVSANDQDALVPATTRAMEAGIPVISWDSGIAADGRLVHLAPSNSELIGRSQVRMIAELIDYEGQIAILSASSQATNQNEWIEWMRTELEEPDYDDMELVSVVYGDDLSDKSYREALGLFNSYPDLRGIISPTTVGIAATARAIQDEGLVDQVELTGLGLPSEMQQYINEGVVERMALWNPIDLGYAAIYITHQFIEGEASADAGGTIDVGRIGELEVGENGNMVLGEPFVFNEENIDEYAELF